jgi:hypothetical protein
LNYRSYTYRFRDTVVANFAAGDSSIFSQWYDLTLNTVRGLNFWLQDKWKLVSNDFSIKQFPETKNPGQFIEAGVRLENFFRNFFLIKNPSYPDNS